MANSNRHRRQRQIAANRQGGLCYWCDMPMVEAEITAEHLVPRHRGGRVVGNIVAACFGCNHNRGEYDAPTPAYIQMRQVNYLRAAGLYAERPYSQNRHDDQPNFGNGLHRGERIWAPQYGIIFGPPDMSRKQAHAAATDRRLG